MGYVNITDISQYISPFQIAKTAGTWTPTITSNVNSDVRTAAAEVFTLLIPVLVPGSHVGTQAAQLKSVDVWYQIATNDATDFATVVLRRTTLNAQTVAVAGANVSEITLDTAHDSAAKRRAIGHHQMKISLNTPVFINQLHAYWVNCVVAAHLNTVFTLYGARVNYTLRI